MKLSSIHTLFAESVIRDETKKVSLINLFDKVYAPQVPTVQPKINIIFWLKTDGKPSNKEPLFLYAYDPKKNKFIEAELKMPLAASDDNETQIVADLSGMPLPTYGMYKFVLGHSKDKAIATRTLLVTDKTDEVKV